MSIIPFEARPCPLNSTRYLDTSEVPICADGSAQVHSDKMRNIATRNSVGHRNERFGKSNIEVSICHTKVFCPPSAGIPVFVTEIDVERKLGCIRRRNRSVSVFVYRYPIELDCSDDFM